MTEATSPTLEDEIRAKRPNLVGRTLCTMPRRFAPCEFQRKDIKAKPLTASQRKAFIAAMLGLASGFAAEMEPRR